MAKAKPFPEFMTKEFLLNLFNYDKEAGTLTWKNPPKGRHELVGKQWGHVVGNDYGGKYLQGIIRKRNYRIHRVIFFIETGLTPDIIDHIDRNGLNNRITNLREADYRLNAANSMTARGMSRLTGAYFTKDKRWVARISIDKKQTHLGSFDTELEAHQAYIKKLSQIKDLELQKKGQGDE